MGKKFSSLVRSKSDSTPKSSTTLNNKNNSIVNIFKPNTSNKHSEFKANNFETSPFDHFTHPRMHSGNDRGLFASRTLDKCAPHCTFILKYAMRITADDTFRNLHKHNTQCEKDNRFRRYDP